MLFTRREILTTLIALLTVPVPLPVPVPKPGLELFFDMSKIPYHQCTGSTKEWLGFERA